TLSDGALEIIEYVVPAKAKVVNKTLKEISNPGEFLVMLQKNAESSMYEIPIGDSIIHAGDHVILITKAEGNGQVLSLWQ
ncbi:MAG: potassium transporter TrkA, partial [Treponema sp.]|nr:potassium transporter TrkA [Treponema sp.]